MSEAIFQQLTGSISFKKRKRGSDAQPLPSPPAAIQARQGLTEVSEAAVKVSDECKAPILAFEDLTTQFKCRSALLRNIAALNFGAPTLVQQHSMPTVLAQRDLYAVAPTGSGKTLAFLIPGLVLAARRRASNTGTGPSVLVVSPTRELAAQTARVLKLLTPGTGVKGSLLVKATAAGTDFSRVDVLVATPLLLADSLTEGKISLTGLCLIVLDEADKLFEAKNGFLQQLDGILAACKECTGLTKCLFSATLPEWVEAVAGSVLQDPLKITVGAKNAACQDVDQMLVFVGREAGKLVALRQMAQQSLKPPVLVFVASKERARQLHTELRFEKIHCDYLCADQSQAARAAAVEAFRTGRTWLLIATDLVARGMDFVGVNTVINYDFPATQTDYIHRVGRTGRAGRSGRAVTFFIEDDAPRLQAIADCMRRAGCAVPEWMLLLKRGHAKRAPGCISERHAADKRARAHKKQIVAQSKAKRDRSQGTNSHEEDTIVSHQGRKSKHRKHAKAQTQQV